MTRGVRAVGEEFLRVILSGAKDLRLRIRRSFAGSAAQDDGGDAAEVRRSLLAALGHGTRRRHVVLPTAREHDGYDLTAMLPVSWVVTPRVVSHTNIGATWFSKTHARSLNLGQTIVYALSPRVQLFVEALRTRDKKERSGLTLVNPAVRARFDVAGGKLVPGLGYAFQLGGSPRNDSILFYFSFEK